jgi:hypothetical protein
MPDLFDAPIAAPSEELLQEELERERRRRQEVEKGTLERRKGLLGRSRAGALAATYTLVGIAVLLTALLFAAVANLGAHSAAPPNITAVPQGQEGLQVIRADPVERSQLIAYLSVPGRLAINGPAEEGILLLGNGVAVGTGTLEAGDTLRVCTLEPVPAVELTLVDLGSGAVLGSHVFLNVPACAAAAAVPLP